MPFRWPFIALLALGFGCGAPGDVGESDVAPSEPVADVGAVEMDRSGQRKIIALGDSLTAGYGINLNEAYPAQLQKLIDEAGYPFHVINSGVSGETSAGGLRRMDYVLRDRDVAVLVVELGANDGLRGLPPREMKKNLNAILDRAESEGIPVLLAGLSDEVEARDRYVQEFLDVFRELSEERDVTYLPGFLNGVAGVSELNQRDGRHPNADGARVVAENVWTLLRPMLDETLASPQ